VKRKTPKPFHRLSTRVGDYRLLGLAWGESDIVKIRNSVTASSSDLRKKAKPRGTHDGLDRRAKVALAGYRLLDPRFRRQLYDRVQLSYIVYRELDELPRDMESSNRLPLISDKLITDKLITDKMPASDKTDASLSLLHESNSDGGHGSLPGVQFSHDLNAQPASSELACIDEPSEQQELGQESSPLEDAREIVRLLNGPRLIDQNKLTRISRWIRVARSVGSLCRMVRCAIL
jgi:hypothetical protein